MRTFLVIMAAIAACDPPEGAKRIPLDQVAVLGQPTMRTSAVGGATDANEVRAWKKVGGGGALYLGEGKPMVASYVLVDAENRSATDAAITLGGTLTGPESNSPLLRESLFVPAGATRTFYLLDHELAARPGATGVEVVVTGAVEARHRPPFEISDFHQFTDGDHVVIAASVVSTTTRDRMAIVHAAFHDQDGTPLSRAHAIPLLVPGVPQTVRFVGPAGSVRGTIFQGDSRDAPHGVYR